MSQQLKFSNISVPILSPLPESLVGPSSFSDLNPLKKEDFQESREILAFDVSRILVIYTGGTFGMKNFEEIGYAPSPDNLFISLSTMPRFHDIAYHKANSDEMKNQIVFSEKDPVPIKVPALVSPLSIWKKRMIYSFLEYDPLLDSSNMTIDEWIKIGTHIELNYNFYDSFIILHGTDTMSFTASALSFMMENLGKTIILTGSQIPLQECRNDAVENFLGALSIAGHYIIPEVTLYFNNRLFRGNRSSKVDATSFNSFATPNFPPLATVGVNIDVRWNNIRHPSLLGEFRVQKALSRNVAALRLFPGISESTVRAFLQKPIEGVVLETYGSGDGPDNRPELLQALSEASSRGVVIVNCTQCSRGYVSDLYKTGKSLSKAGVIPGADMTLECALVKLAHLLPKHGPQHVERVRAEIREDLRGELTVINQLNPKFNKSFDKNFATNLRSLLNCGESDIICISDALDSQTAQLIFSIFSARGLLKELKGLAESCSTVRSDIPDYTGATPMHHAVVSGSIGTVAFLIDHKKEKEGKLLPFQLVFPLDRSNASPLHFAILRNRYREANLLIEEGYKLQSEEIINVINNALVACCSSNNQSVELYIRAGLDPNQKSRDGSTLLHKAVSCLNHELVFILVKKYNADPNLTDIYNRTSYEEAKFFKIKIKNDLKIEITNQQSLFLQFSWIENILKTFETSEVGCLKRLQS